MKAEKERPELTHEGVIGELLSQKKRLRKLVSQLKSEYSTDRDRAVLKKFDSLFGHEAIAGENLPQKFLILEASTTGEELRQIINNEIQSLQESGEYYDRLEETELLFKMFEDLLPTSAQPRTLDKIVQLAANTFISQRRDRIKGIVDKADVPEGEKFDLAGPEQIMAILLIRLQIASALQNTPLDENVMVRIANNKVGIVNKIMKGGPYDPLGFGLHLRTSHVDIKDAVTVMKIDYARGVDSGNPDYFVSGFNFSPKTAQNEQPAV